MKTKKEINNIEEQVWEILKSVIDPEVEINIVDMGLIYKIEYDGDSVVNVEMTLSTPACPIGDVLVLNVVEAIKGALPELETNVNLTFEPPWTPDMVSAEGKKSLSF